MLKLAADGRQEEEDEAVGEALQGPEAEAGGDRAQSLKNLTAMCPPGLQVTFPIISVTLQYLQCLGNTVSS